MLAPRGRAAHAGGIIRPAHNVLAVPLSESRGCYKGTSSPRDGASTYLALTFGTLLSSQGTEASLKTALAASPGFPFDVSDSIRLLRPEFPPCFDTLKHALAPGCHSGSRGNVLDGRARSKSRSCSAGVSAQIRRPQATSTSEIQVEVEASARQIRRFACFVHRFRCAIYARPRLLNSYQIASIDSDLRAQRLMCALDHIQSESNRFRTSRIRSTGRFCVC